jgi:hypothetical protein
LLSYSQNLIHSSRSFAMYPSKINFEMTPEREAIMQLEIDVPDHHWLHPNFRADTTKRDENDCVIYDSSMKLPEVDDQKGILAWLGINEEASEIVLQDYKEYLAGNVPLLYGTFLRPSSTLERTLINHLAEMFVSGIARE